MSHVWSKRSGQTPDMTPPTIWAGSISNVRERCEKGVKNRLFYSDEEKINRYLMFSPESGSELYELKNALVSRIGDTHT